jgi:hypothetical protein
VEIRRRECLSSGEHKPQQAQLETTEGISEQAAEQQFRSVLTPSTGGYSLDGVFSVATALHQIMTQINVTVPEKEKNTHHNENIHKTCQFQRPLTSQAFQSRRIFCKWHWKVPISAQ